MDGKEAIAYIRARRAEGATTPVSVPAVESAVIELDRRLTLLERRLTQQAVIIEAEIKTGLPMAAIQAQVDAGVMEMVRAKGMVTIGELIGLLAGRPPAHEVRFDFGGYRPVRLASYRGYYHHLAIEYDDRSANQRRPADSPPWTVTTMMAELQKAVGETFTGYKGGDYTMGLDTPCWVANYGECHGTGVVGLAGGQYATVLATGYCED